MVYAICELKTVQQCAEIHSLTSDISIKFSKSNARNLNMRLLRDHFYRDNKRPVFFLNLQKHLQKKRPFISSAEVYAV